MITIYSPGKYASVHASEEYIKGNKESEIRNAKIARVLYLNKSMEQFGGEFKRVDSLYRDAGIRYAYEMLEQGFKFKYY